MRGGHYLKLCFLLIFHNRFVARQNQRVTEAIMERITNETQVYDAKVIKSKFIVLQQSVHKTYPL